MLTTKTNVGQFLLVFNPLLKICNMLFTELLIKKHGGIEDYNLIKSNTTEAMYEFNPYENSENKADIKYKEDDHIEYRASEVALKTTELMENKVIGFTEGQYVTLKRILENNIIDTTIDQEIYIALEKTYPTHILRNTEYNDFSVRR